MKNRLGDKADFSFCGKRECADRVKDIKEEKYDRSELLMMCLECGTCMDLEIKEREKNGSIDKLNKLKLNLIKLLAEKTFGNS